MAIGKVTFVREDGTLNSPATGYDHVSGLLFDLPSMTSMPSGVKLNDVIQIFSTNEAVNLGITPYEEEGESNFFYGIPHFHISEFFRMNPNGSLYVMFANCDSDWSAIKTIQAAAQGNIRQLGVWTSKMLWTTSDEGVDPYTLNIVADVNTIAEELANEHRPLSILLNANTSIADSTKTDKTVSLMRIPTCVSDWARTSVLIGQGRSSKIKAMQIAHAEHPSIGCLGTCLGCVSRAKVCESIAWLDQFNLYNTDYADIELGFGDMNLNDDESDFVSTLPFEALSPTQVDEIDNKGYIFPVKYTGADNGTYFSFDHTCSNGDFRTIARNRTIDKSRRAIRSALLPYVNSPISINPSNGRLQEIETKKFETIVSNILSSMQGNGEISGYSVLIPTDQNVLETDTLKIQYSIIPIATSKNIVVTEGLALTTT